MTSTVCPGHVITTSYSTIPLAPAFSWRPASPSANATLASRPPTDRATGDAMACRKGGERQFVTVQAVEDFRFDRIQARSAHAAAVRSFGGVTRSAERKRDEIVDVTDHELAEFRCREFLLVLDDADAARQQPQYFAVARDRPQETLCGARNHTGQQASFQRDR